MRPRGVWASPVEPSALLVLGSFAVGEAVTLRDSTQHMQTGCVRFKHAFLEARAGTRSHTHLGDKKSFHFNDLMMVMIIWGGGVIVPLPRLFLF